MPSTTLDPIAQIVLIGLDVSTTLPSADGSDAAIWYPEALNAVLAGDIVLTSDTFILYPAATPFDPAHEFRADLPVGALVGNPSDQFGLTAGTAEFDTGFTMLRHFPDSDPLITDGVTSTLVRAGIVVLDTGSAATDRLVAYLGRHIDNRQINQAPSSDGALSWSFDVDDGILVI